MAQDYHYDTIIIGAGLAGIAAGRSLEKYNSNVRKDDHNTYIVLEAGKKIGGRVQSETIAIDGMRPITIEKGAQWAHAEMRQDAPENPLLRHIRKTTPLEHDDMPREFWVHGQRMKYMGNIRRIDQARHVIDDYRGIDIDLASLFDRADLGSDNASLTTTFGPAETGRPLNEVGVEDMRGLVSRNKGEFSRNGLSAFIKNYARRVEPHIQLNTPITRICWDDKEKSVTVHAANGDTYHGRNCIITVSVGVLQSGAISFEPPLPERHKENLSHVKMADFNKISLIFDSGFAFPVNHNTHLDVRTKSDEDIFYLARVNGQPVVTAFMGDDLARLCDSDPAAATETAIKGLCEIWGNEVRNHIIDSRVTQWGNDPLVRGGYSSVDVGHYSARQALAEPIGNVLYLAGEAVGAIHHESGRDWATHMTGAAISGKRAAHCILRHKEQEKSTPYQHMTGAEGVGIINRR